MWVRGWKEKSLLLLAKTVETHLKSIQLFFRKQFLLRNFMKTRGFYFNMKGIFRDDCMPVGEIELVISVFPGYWPKLAAELFHLFCFSF